MTTGVALAFLAGALSVLSPCVLPLLPLVFGAAAAEHKYGPALLALGVALSFAAIGLFVATIGFGLGFDGEFFRRASAALMLMLGAVLISPALQRRFAAFGGPMSDVVERRFGGFSTRGAFGQFSLGLLLGAVWSPCVGPTLGAASLLAARGEKLSEAAVTMGAFGLGAALPLAALGLLSRHALMRWRDALMIFGKGAKAALGVVFLSVGGLILLGFDKRLEALLVAASPDWLTSLTTRF
jgi:cytochrome c-type biogenesis protein